MYVETSQYFRQEIAFLFQGKVRVIWIPKWSFSSSCFIAGDSHLKTIFLYAVALREKYPNTELFLVRNILYSDWINLTPKVSIFSPNTGKYGPEINPYLDTFDAVFSLFIIPWMIIRKTSKFEWPQFGPQNIFWRFQLY